MPEDAESLAIPRARQPSTKGKTAVACTVRAEGKRHHGKHRRVNIKEDYVKSLHQEIDNLKALVDEQRQLYDKELKELKAGRLSREEQVQQDLHASTQPDTQPTGSAGEDRRTA